MTTFPIDGAVIEWSDDGTNFEAIPSCVGVGFPEETQEYKDFKRLDHQGRHKRYKRAMIDGGEVTLVCDYSRASYKKALAKRDLEDGAFIRVTLPPDETQSAGDKVSWQAFVNVAIQDAEKGDDLMLEIKLKTNGPVAWDEGALL